MKTNRDFVCHVSFEISVFCGSCMILGRMVESLIFEHDEDAIMGLWLRSLCVLSHGKTYL